jgi:hypothetical protein
MSAVSCALHVLVFDCATVRWPAMIMIRCTGPPTPDKIRIYHNLVAALAFLVMIGPSATVFYKQYLSYNGLLLVQCQLGL